MNNRDLTCTNDYYDSRYIEILNTGSDKIPMDFEIPNRPYREYVHYTVCPNQMEIDEDFKNLKIPISVNLRDSFKYYGKMISVNLYKFCLVKLLFKLTNDETFKFLITLTCENLFSFKHALQSPSDIATVCSNLVEKPTWSFIVNLMQKKPPIRFIFVNVNNLSDVREYQPFLGDSETTAIFYYNKGNASLANLQGKQYNIMY